MGCILAGTMGGVKIPEKIGCGYKLCKTGGFDWVGRPIVGVGRRGMMLTVPMTCPPRRLTLNNQAVSSRARQAGWIVQGFR